MEIIVSDIPPEGLVVDCSRDGEWFHKQATEEVQNRFQAREVLFHCSVTRMGRQAAIRGTVELHLNASCTRCLEPFPLSMEGNFFYAMNPLSRREDGGEVELAPGDLEMGFYADDRIDLEPIMSEQVFLQLPVRTLCGEDCKGLCSTCGANLNREYCDHARDIQAASPFAALKNFKITKKRS